MIRRRDVQIPTGDVGLPGHLSVPDGAIGTVIFAYGSAVSRLSARNRRVAESLAQSGFATLLLDLLTPEEGRDRENVFDIVLQAARLHGAVDWVARELPDLPIGLFGAGTGTAAALAESRFDSRVRAVVSRGGRPDLAGPLLAGVTAPTLLLVGGDDVEMMVMNRDAMQHIGGVCRLRVIPGASQLFEEPGALERVTALAAEWFREHLRLPMESRHLLATGRRASFPALAP